MRKILCFFILIVGIYFVVPISTVSAQTVIQTCTGQCKGDQPSTKYINNHECQGIDNKWYICKNGSFVSSTETSTGGTSTDGTSTVPFGVTAPGIPAPAPTPQPRACGEACKTTADCRNPSTGGFPVECRNGTCQLPLTGPYACAEGKSAGSICSCSTKQQCGQPCGPAVGNKLCNPGTVCGFLTPSNACMVNGAQQTTKQYCLPVNPNQGYSLKRCDTTPAINYIAADSLQKPNGTQTSLTATDLTNACTAVCGDKVVGVGEQCDWGSENGKPGSLCDATCKTRNKCGDACSYQSMCNRHVVTLRCDITVAARRYCGLDAIIEGGVTIEQTDPRIVGPGMWRTSTSTIYSGGSEIYNHENGATISFVTTSREITLVHTKASNRAAFTVLIDGKVQPTKVDQYNATSVSKQQTVLNLRGPDSPEYQCSNSVCRLATDTSDLTCGITAPTPAPPTDIPVPTPQTLACGLTSTFTTTGNPAALQYGDMVTFLLPAISKTTHPTYLPETDTVRYEGEIAAYRGNTMVKKDSLVVGRAYSQFQPYKITAGNATYFTRFRYCITNPKTAERCSAWGTWAAPNGGAGTPVVPTSPTHTPPPSNVACATPPVCPRGSSLIYGDPRDGGCPQYQCSPSGTTTPTKPTQPTAPPGCEYKTVQCFQAPCDPILVCESPLPASTKTVKFVNKTSTGRISMVVDYIKEGTTVLQESSPRITYAGTWRTASDSSPSGGAYRATSLNGDSFSLTTSQQSIIYRTYKYSQRSDVEVYVDGVLKNTITGLNAGSGWVDIPVALN